MATFICCDPTNWDAFSVLLEHPATDRNQLTTLTKVHLLHIVVSLLSMSVLKHVLQSGFSLLDAALTAAGHTLLHIACLPLDITHVNIFQESIYNSAHEFRQLSASRMTDYIIFDGDTPQPQPTDWFAAQTEMVFYLLSQSPDPDALIAAQDCHGNTAFHCLAMHKTTNQGLSWAVKSKLRIVMVLMECVLRGDYFAGLDNVTASDGPAGTDGGDRIR